MNRREFVKSGLFALAAMNFPRLVAAEVAAKLGVPAAALTPEMAALEKDLLAQVMAKFEAVNPIDPKTGKRKFISFGFVTDLHTCKRQPDDDLLTGAKTGYWYFGSLTDCEPSIRLLGAVAEKAGLDGVLNGGDYSTANSPTPLTDAEYIDQIASVKALFDRYLPKTPFFAIDGNHDRAYENKSMNAKRYMDDATWGKVLATLNTDVSKNPDVGLTMHRDLKNPTLSKDKPGAYTGNSYSVDFKRLVKSGGPNVRMVCMSLYDRSPAASPSLRAYDGYQFYDPVTKALIDPTLTPENTIVGLAAHDASRMSEMACSLYLKAGTRMGNSTDHTPLKSNLGEHKGMGFLGMIAGHLHQSLVKQMKGYKFSNVQVTNCYASKRAGGRKYENFGKIGGYRFSLFTVDTDANVLHETRLAGKAPENLTTEIQRS